MSQKNMALFGLTIQFAFFGIDPIILSTVMFAVVVGMMKEMIENRRTA